MAKEKSKEAESFLETQATEAFCKGNIRYAAQLYSEAMRVKMDTGQAENESKRDSDSDKDSVSGDCEDLNQTRFLPGEVSGMLDVLKETLKAAEMTIQVMPHCPKGYLNTAFVFILLNKWEDARKVYMKGIQVCPNSESLRCALDKLTDTEKLLQSASKMVDDFDVMSDTSSDTLSRCGSMSQQSSVRRRKFGFHNRKRLSRKLSSGELTNLFNNKGTSPNESSCSSDTSRNSSVIYS